MDSSKSFIERVWNEPPVFFPIAVLFHLFLLVRGMVDFGDLVSTRLGALTIAWYAVGFVLSIFVLLLRRWAAIAYLLLTATGVVLQLTLPKGALWHDVGTTLFPIDAIMMALIFFFYKRFH